MNRSQYCPGACLHASVRYQDQPRGRCRVCGGWFALSAGSRLVPHGYKRRRRVRMPARAAA